MTYALIGGRLPFYAKNPTALQNMIKFHQQTYTGAVRAFFEIDDVLVQRFLFLFVVPKCRRRYFCTDRDIGVALWIRYNSHCTFTTLLCRLFC